MSTTHYNPAAIHVVFAGHFIDGYGDGTMISVTKAADDYSTKWGPSGKAVRTKLHNKGGTMTITLMQTSLSNDRLSEIRQHDYLVPNGGGVGSLTIQNIEGTDIHTAENAWIQSAPDLTFEGEAGTREWVIAFDKLVSVYGH